MRIDDDDPIPARQVHENDSLGSLLEEDTGVSFFLSGKHINCEIENFINHSKLRVILRSRVLLLRIVYDFMEDIDRLAAPLDDSAQGQQDDCTEQAVLRRCIISRRGNLFNYSRKASSFIYHVSYWLCEQQSGLHYCADRSASSPTVASF